MQPHETNSINTRNGHEPAISEELPDHPRALLLPSHQASLKEMLYVAGHLTRTRRWQCTFVIEWRCPQNWCQKVTDAGHELLLRHKPITTSAIHSKKPADSKLDAEGRKESISLTRRWKNSGLKRVIDQTLRHVGVKPTFNFVHCLSSYRKAVRRAKQLLHDVSPDVILLPSDRLVGLETALIMRARRRRIPSVVIPWAISLTTGSFYYRSCQDDWEYTYGMRRWSNRSVARHFPDLVYREGEEAMLFLPGEAILAAKAWGIMNPHPWRSAGSGLADCVMVEGERLYQTAVEAGVPAGKLVKTGRASSDIVYDNSMHAASLRPEICRQFNLRPESRIVLCSVPQLAEHKLCSVDQHQREIEFLFETLGSLKNANILLALHPKSKVEDYREPADRHGLVIADGLTIEQLIPVCDIFVSAFSSTAVMAIGCGKPAVLLDLYGMGYNLFADCPGSLVVQEKDELQPLLARIVNDRDYFEGLAEAQRQIAKQWIQLDGQCGHRMIETIDALVSSAVKNQVAPASARQLIGKRHKAA